MHHHRRRRLSLGQVMDPPFPPENPPQYVDCGLWRRTWAHGGPLNHYNIVMPIRGVVASAYYLRYKMASATRHLGPPPIICSTNAASPAGDVASAYFLLILCRYGVSRPPAIMYSTKRPPPRVASGLRVLLFAVQTRHPPRRTWPPPIFSGYYANTGCRGLRPLCTALSGLRHGLPRASAYCFRKSANTGCRGLRPICKVLACRS